MYYTIKECTTDQFININILSDLLNQEVKEIDYHKLPEFIKKDDVLILTDYEAKISKFLLDQKSDGTDISFKEWAALQSILYAAKAGAKVVAFDNASVLLAKTAGSMVLKMKNINHFIDSVYADRTAIMDVPYNFTSYHFSKTHLLYGLHNPPENRIKILSTHSHLIYPFNLHRKDYRIIAYAGIKSVKEDDSYCMTYGSGVNYFDSELNAEASSNVSALSEYEYFGITTESSSLQKVFGNNKVIDPEIIHFPKHRFLCVTEGFNINGGEIEYGDYLRKIINLFTLNQL